MSASGRHTRRPLRVAHVTHTMEIGGAERVIERLISRADEQAIEPHIVCLDNAVGPIGHALAERGVSISALVRRSGFDRRTVNSLRAYAQRHAIDVLHCHQHTPWTYGALAAPRGTRVVFTEHGRFFPDGTSLKRRLANQWLRLRTEAFTAISEATRDALVRHEWLAEDEIEVIYNGVDTPSAPTSGSDVRTEFGASPHSIMVGTVARLDPIKNISLLIDTFAALVRSDTNRDLRLMIAGDGPEREPLEAQAKRTGVSDRIVFAGFRDDPERVLASLDVFVLPSHSEGTSMTLIEAMALGTTCVVTDVGGNPEVIEDETTGLIVPPADPAALETALERVVIDVELRDRLGRAANAAFMRRFTTDRMAARYAALYQRITSRRGRHPDREQDG